MLKATALALACLLFAAPMVKSDRLVKLDAAIPAPTALLPNPLFIGSIGYVLDYSGSTAVVQRWQMAAAGITQLSSIQPAQTDGLALASTGSVLILAHIHSGCLTQPLGTCIKLQEYDPAQGALQDLDVEVPMQQTANRPQLFWGSTPACTGGCVFVLQQGNPLYRVNLAGSAIAQQVGTAALPILSRTVVHERFLYSFSGSDGSSIDAVVRRLDLDSGVVTRLAVVSPTLNPSVTADASRAYLFAGIENGSASDRISWFDFATETFRTRTTTFPFPIQHAGLALYQGEPDVFGVINGGAVVREWYHYDPSNQLPVASFTSGEAWTSRPVQFTSTSSDDNALTFAWNFGDGASSGAENPTHTFQAPGTYQVTLVITDADGVTAQATQEVQVAAQQTSVPPATNPPPAGTNPPPATGAPPSSTATATADPPSSSSSPSSTNAMASTSASRTTSHAAPWSNSTTVRPLGGAPQPAVESGGREASAVSWSSIVALAACLVAIRRGSR